MLNNKIHELYALEELSSGNTYIHTLHPTVKIITTAVFIITVVSFDRSAFVNLVPYIFYPAILMALSETPYSMLLKRFSLALPFALFAGLANVILDLNPAFTLGNITVSYGVISIFTILLKTYLCVMAVLLLVSVTPLTEVTDSMRRLKIPHIFIVMFEMIYRYIAVLFEEATSMYTAYSLRSSGKNGIEMKYMGNFVGQLLLRSFDRAERVYNAMKCRGYNMQSRFAWYKKIEQKDVIFCLITCFLFIAFRFINVNELFNKLFGGLG